MMAGMKELGSRHNTDSAGTKVADPPPRWTAGRPVVGTVPRTDGQPPVPVRVTSGDCSRGVSDRNPARLCVRVQRSWHDDRRNPTDNRGGRSINRKERWGDKPDK
jgi:hypothetical protein